MAVPRSLFVALAITSVSALNNGVGKLPKLGYDTFNAFGCDYDSNSTIVQAQLLAKYGLVAAGYNSFILDDCVTLHNRSASGQLQEDRVKFPQGMKAWTKTINALGISGSAYSSNGYYTCAGYPAGYGHEVQDLETYRSWGWNYIKYDNCYIPFDNFTQANEYHRFQRMTDAIAQVAKKYNEPPFWYSLCQWGWNSVTVWGPRLAQSWRINGDIKPYWASIAAIIDEASFVAQVANFYQHNDLDILEVGNTGIGTPPGNLTYDESKTHFTAWAFLKSPLIIGTDLTKATNQTLEILGNKEILAINQDPLVGEGVTPFRWGINPDFVSNSTHPAQYWSGNSSYGVVFMLINTLDEPATMGFNLTESWAIRAGRQYHVRDLWKHADIGIAVRNWTGTVPAHGVAALLLKDAGPEPAAAAHPACAWPLLAYQCSNPQGQYIGNGTFNGGWPGVGGYGFTYV